MATLVIVTLAPLITAAEGSVTFPTMLPVPTVVWANNGVDQTLLLSALPEAQ